MFKTVTNRTIKLAAAGAVMLGGLAVATPAAAVPNLLANGSFELGADGFQSWSFIGTETQGYPPVAIYYGSASGYPTGAYGEAVAAPLLPQTSNSPDMAGARAAYFVSDYSQAQGITQTITLDPGTYQVGFSMYLPQNGFNNAGDAHFTAVLAGLTLLDVTASSLLPVTWMNYAAGVTIYGDSAQTVNFTFSTNFFPSKDVVIDQVYVIAGNPPVDGNPPNITVPEPASLALLGSGLLGLALMVNRRRRQG